MKIQFLKKIANRLSSPFDRESLIGHRGAPSSSNGASSFHLHWRLPEVPLKEVSATIEVLVPPKVEKLYFWALQVGFVDGTVPKGGAHIGLQYHPRFANKTCVNWGGYHDAGGGELDGSESALMSDTKNKNSRNYQWVPGVRYRYRISQGSQKHTWSGSIKDLSTGVETHIRDLYVEADSIRFPIVWTESFADHDHPSVKVAWSDFQAVASSGEVFEIDEVQTKYQSCATGGSALSCSTAEEGMFVQETKTSRTNASRSLLKLPE